MAASPPAALPAPAAPTLPSAGAAAAPSVPAARKSPMQALNQMVTAQALLVSLLLAPLSKDAAEAPMAQVDTPSTAPTR
ncbi:MAG TPA: hypothetical protein VMG12_14635 [Polyangiaceae bacterium]|nr:hypothetical protein [Polyangiaceae bacterium]